MLLFFSVSSHLINNKIYKRTLSLQSTSTLNDIMVGNFSGMFLSTAISEVFTGCMTIKEWIFLMRLFYKNRIF